MYPQKRETHYCEKCEKEVEVHEEAKQAQGDEEAYTDEGERLIFVLCRVST